MYAVSIEFTEAGANDLLQVGLFPKNCYLSIRQFSCCCINYSSSSVSVKLAIMLPEGALKVTLKFEMFVTFIGLKSSYLLQLPPTLARERELQSQVIQLQQR